MRRRAPWILSPNGGGRTIDEAKADALLVADALEHPDSHIRTGRHDVPFMAVTHVLIQATTATMTCKACVRMTLPTRTPGRRRIAAMLRNAAAGVVDHEDAHVPTREEAIRTLASSRMADMVHDDVIVSMSRPTPLVGPLAAVLRSGDGGPFDDFEVENDLPSGRIVLTSTPETDRDVDGSRIVSVSLDPYTSSHRLEGVDAMEVLRIMRT